MGKSGHPRLANSICSDSVTFSWQTCSSQLHILTFPKEEQGLRIQLSLSKPNFFPEMLHGACFCALHSSKTSRCCYSLPVQQRFTLRTPPERLSPSAVIPLSIIHSAAALSASVLSAWPRVGCDGGAAVSKRGPARIPPALGKAERVTHTADDSQPREGSRFSIPWRRAQHHPREGEVPAMDWELLLLLCGRS